MIRSLGLLVLLALAIAVLVPACSDPPPPEVESCFEIERLARGILYVRNNPKATVSSEEMRQLLPNHGWVVNAVYMAPTDATQAEVMALVVSECKDRERLRGCPQ